MMLGKYGFIMKLFIYLNYIKGGESLPNSVNPNTDTSHQLNKDIDGEKNEFHRITMEQLEYRLKVIEEIKAKGPEQLSNELVICMNDANSICTENFDEILTSIKTFDENINSFTHEDEKKSYDILCALKKMLKDYENDETMNTSNLYRGVIIEIISKLVAEECSLISFILPSNTHYNSTLVKVIELFQDTFNKVKNLFDNTLSKNINHPDMSKFTEILEQYDKRTGIVAVGLYKHYMVIKQ